MRLAGSNPPFLPQIQHSVGDSRRCHQVRLLNLSRGQRALLTFHRGKRAMADALSKIKKKLQDEITTLEYEMNVDLPKELMKARAHGDLSENAEFKYAKERQGYVSARLGQLKKRLGDLGMLNLNNIPV